MIFRLKNSLCRKNPISLQLYNFTTYQLYNLQLYNFTTYQLIILNKLARAARKFFKYAIDFSCFSHEILNKLARAAQTNFKYMRAQRGKFLNYIIDTS